MLRVIDIKEIEQEQCSKNYFWQVLKTWVYHNANLDFFTFVEELKKAGKSNLRIDEFQRICALTNMNDEGKFENSILSIRDLILAEKNAYNSQQKMILHKQISVKLDDIEDLVSCSLLQNNLQQNNLIVSMEEMREHLRNPKLTRCLSARRFEVIANKYPFLVHEVLVENPDAYPFVTVAFRQAWNEIVSLDKPSIGEVRITNSGSR